MQMMLKNQQRWLRQKLPHLLLELVGIFMLIYISMTPTDELVIANILQYFVTVTPNSYLINYIYPAEFVLTFILSIIGALLVFVPFPFNISWRTAILRCTDILWLLGAGATLLVTVTLLQEDRARGEKDRYERDLSFYDKSRVENLDKAQKACEKKFEVPGKDASRDFKEASVFVDKICSSIPKTELSEDPWEDAFDYARVAIKNCKMIGIDFDPPGEGPSYSDDLRSNKNLFETYQVFEYFCYIDYHVARLKREIEPLDAMLERLEPIDSTHKTVGWFRLFVLALALRMTRGFFEVTGDIRAAIRSENANSADKKVS